MKILVTGGPVSTQLDAVKIITNRFKGGLMVDLAQRLATSGEDVLYLTENGTDVPTKILVSGVEVIRHDGLQSYHEMVLDLASQMDAVILGAAVANLMPLKPWTDKFPSHDYKPGEVIPIDFVLTPRIIDEIHVVAPLTHLFGFKLLANVDHEELIKAAYEIVLSAHCTTVFANDRSNLGQIYAVTKERGVHPMFRGDIASWVITCLNDQYYRTEFIGRISIPDGADEALAMLLVRFDDKFQRVEGDFIFGTAAIRIPYLGFLTTTRGKKELSSFVLVDQVDTHNRVVYCAGESKATLNAPLLHQIFLHCPEAMSIVHYHKMMSDIPTLSYAPPGTMRDSLRYPAQIRTSFNIEHHGCFLLLDKNGKQL